MENTKKAYGYTLGNEALGIGTIWYSEGYFQSGDGKERTILNPVTGKNYTKKELEAVKEKMEEGGLVLPEGAYMAITPYGQEKTFFYTAAEAKRILSHSDALVLDKADGRLSTLSDGRSVAESMS